MGGRGSGGKNRKPTALKKLEGNPGHRKLNEKEPEPAPGIPPMPKDLSRKAQLEWKRLVPILSDMKVLTVADQDALGALCTARVRWRQAEDLIDRMGQLVTEKTTLPDGTIKIRVKKNPAVTVASDALRHYRGLLADFGLTPASRSGIKVDNPKNGHASDPMDDYLSGKAAGEVVM